MSAQSQKFDHDDNPKADYSGEDTPAMQETQQQVEHDPDGDQAGLASHLAELWLCAARGQNNACNEIDQGDKCGEQAASKQREKAKKGQDAARCDQTCEEQQSPPCWKHKEKQRRQQSAVVPMVRFRSGHSFSYPGA